MASAIFGQKAASAPFLRADGPDQVSAQEIERNAVSRVRIYCTNGAVDRGEQGRRVSAPRTTVP